MATSIVTGLVVWVQLFPVCLTSECPAGYYGGKCSYLCANRHCSNTAKSACNPVTGACQNGCNPGWSGDDCMQDPQMHSVSPTCSPCGCTSPVLAGFIGAIITAILAVIPYVLWRYGNTIRARLVLMLERKEDGQESDPPPTPIADVCNANSCDQPQPDSTYESLNLSSADKENPYCNMHVQHQ